MPNPDTGAQGAPVASQEAEAREAMFNTLVGTYYHEYKLDGTYDSAIDAYADAIRSSERERYAALVAAIDAERVKFQNETLRTSELTTLLLRFEKLMVDRDHEPGAWSRGCADCELVAEARALISKPVNVRALAGSREASDD